MPIADAGFITKEGHPDKDLLLAFGPTTQVVVQHYSPDGSEVPPDSETVHALIDSGATESCIDSKLAESLGLPIIDKRMCGGVNGSSEHNVYMAQVVIPSVNFTTYGAFMGVHLEDGGQAHKVLLGRSFLAGGIMIYDGLRGIVSISF